MDIVLSSEDGNEQQEWPLTPELIGTIMDVGSHRFNSSHARKIREITQGYTGCLVLVFDNGKLLLRKGMIKVPNVIIGPSD